MSSLPPQQVSPTELIRAEFYVALHRGTPGDVEVYREACRGARRVLELGCGDGRVLFDLRDVVSAEPGAPALVGLDRDTGMLALARRRAAELGLGAQGGVSDGAVLALLSGDMRDFDIEGSFDRIILPYCGLWCLPDEDKLSCLRAARRHLANGGELYFDVYDADGMDEGTSQVSPEQPIEDEFELVAEVEVGSSRYDVFEKNSYWFDKRVVEATFEYRAQSGTDATPSEATTQVITHYYLEHAALISLLAAAGFTRVDLLGDLPGCELPEGQLFFRCAPATSAVS